MYTSFCFGLEVPLWANLFQKIKSVSLRSDFKPSLVLNMLNSMAMFICHVLERKYFLGQI